MTNMPINLKKEFPKLAFTNLYFATTSILPCYLLITCYHSKHSIIYACTVTFISLIVIDIICTLLEEQYFKIRNWLRRKKQKKKAEKEKEMKNLENLLLDKKSYEKEIESAEESIKLFKEKIQSKEYNISKKMLEQVFRICTKMEDLINDLKKDTEQYYQVRHTFQVYFPEFQKMTYLFFNIFQNNSLDKESKADYQNMLTEYEKYIDYIKGNINTMDKLNLKVGITSLVKIIESERKKGEENAEK